MALVPYQGMPQGWMRQIIGASSSRPSFRSPVGCIGHFWDNVRKRSVSVDMGYVALRPLSSFRAAASVSVETAFEGVEVAAQSEEISTESEGQKEVRVLCNTRTLANPLAKSC